MSAKKNGTPQTAPPVWKMADTSWKEALRAAALIGAILVLLAIPGARLVAVPMLGIWALLGFRQAIQSLTLLVVIRNLNPGIYDLYDLSSIWGWIVLACAGARIYLDAFKANMLYHPVLPWLLFFSAIVLVESALTSYYPLVSAFKLLSFLYASAALLIAFRMSAAKSVDWTPWFLGLWISVLALSLPILFFPGIGYLRDDQGFQGILDHPQAFALFLVPCIAWMFGRTVLNDRKASTVLLGLLSLACAYVFMTKARTAVVAVFAAFPVILAIGFLGKTIWLKKTIQRFSLLKILGVVLILFIAFQTTSLSDVIAEFVIKNSGETSTVADAFEQSRGYIIAESWLNFSEHQYSGIGFGVTFNEFFQPSIEPITGLPLSAPTEKGLLPVVVLEETGLLGLVGFLPFLFCFARRAMFYGELAMLWMFLACVFINVGEVVFFSVGGLGLYIWLLMGWAASGRRPEAIIQARPH